MANAPSKKGLAVSIMACTPGIMWKLPSTLDKEPSIRSLAPIIVTRAPNMMVKDPKTRKGEHKTITTQLWRSRERFDYPCHPKTSMKASFSVSA